MGKELKIVIDYPHRAGKNCGSTSLWNLAKYWGNDFEEHTIFGLSSGIHFWYFPFEFNSAQRSVAGRNPSLVKDFFDNIGIDFSWHQSGNFPLEEIKNYLKSGIPVIAQTDLFYLEYYGDGRVHFPGHEIVIIGYDENNQTFFVSDSSFPDVKIVDLGSLKKAMNPPISYLVPLENNFSPVPKFSFSPNEENILKSLYKVSERFLNGNDYSGLQALKKFAEEIDMWFHPSSRWTARFCYQVIEKRGTGGGLFRKMYSDFIFSINVDIKRKENIRKSSFLWTEIAKNMKSFSLGENVDVQYVKNIAKEIYNLEKDFFEEVYDIVKKQMLSKP